MMNSLDFLIELFRDWSVFAIWQSFLILGLAVTLERFLRHSPWQAHLLLTLGILASVLTPTFSFLIFRSNGGMISSGSIFVMEKQVVGPASVLGPLIFCGGVIFALFLLYGIVSARRLIFQAQPFPDRESQEALLEGSRLMQNISLPILFTSPSVKSPTVWSWGLHPAVLLPETLAETLTSEERDGIFLHELAHTIRRDHWSAFMVRFCGILLFWNPLYWLAVKLGDLAADRACDLLVLSQEKVSPEIYAETLLRLAAGEKNRPVLQYLSRKEQLMKRIETILDYSDNRNRFSVTGSPVRMIGLLFAVLFLSTALAFCQEKKQKTSISPEKETQVGEHSRPPIWFLSQEAQDRPPHIEVWNGKANMMTMIYATRFGGKAWLELTEEQQKKLGFLGKQQEFGVEWFQKMHNEQNAELIEAEEVAKALIPSDDPQFEKATEEQKRAYVEAVSKPMILFYRSVQNEINETLTPEQLKKLRSLEFTMLPETIAPTPHMFDSLGLSEEQQKKVEAIKKEFEPEFLKLLDEQMELRKEHLVLYTQGKNSDADRKEYNVRYKEQTDRRAEFAKRLRERLAKDVLTDEQRAEAKKLADELPDSMKQQFYRASYSKTEPEKVRSYRVDKKVSEFPENQIDLSTPEAAYALSNRIIAGDEPDRIASLQQYTVMRSADPSHIDGEFASAAAVQEREETEEQHHVGIVSHRDQFNEPEESAEQGQGEAGNGLGLQRRCGTSLCAVRFFDARKTGRSGSVLETISRLLAVRCSFGLRPDLRPA